MASYIEIQQWLKGALAVLGLSTRLQPFAIHEDVGQASKILLVRRLYNHLNR